MGVRGNLGLEFVAKGAKRNLHSGNFGGAIAFRIPTAGLAHATGLPVSACRSVDLPTRCRSRSSACWNASRGQANPSCSS